MHKAHLNGRYTVTSGASAICGKGELRVRRYTTVRKILGTVVCTVQLLLDPRGFLATRGTSWRKNGVLSTRSVPNFAV